MNESTVSDKISSPFEGCVVIEDFLDYPHAVEQHAMLSEFIDWKGPDGQVYKRVSLLRVPGVLKKLQEHLGPIEMLGQAYRLNYEGEKPNQSIHTDLGWGTHALVLYLRDGPSGTAFWRHKETGEEKFIPGPQSLDLYNKLSGSWESPEDWKLVNTVEMKQNRAVIYDSTLFHSRYPFEAFGSNVTDGRLIAVAFFALPQGLPELPQ